MALIAMVGAKGSPGVTCTALAFALTWSRPVVLVECDPAGGDIAAGFLQHLQLDRGRGLAHLAAAELRGRAAELFAAQLVDLDPPHQQRLLLPGIATPAQARALQPVWHRLADFLTRLEPYDVVADCGRLVAPHPPWPLLQRADAVLVVARPTLASLSSARTAIGELRGQGGGHRSTRVLLVGEGPYDRQTVARQLDTEVVGELPHDPASARVLSHGGTLRLRCRLLRAAIAAGLAVRRAAATHRALLTASKLEGTHV